MNTLTNPYFLNLYILNKFFFFFNFRVGTCPPWSDTGSAGAWNKNWGLVEGELTGINIMSTEYHH